MNVVAVLPRLVLRRLALSWPGCRRSPVRPRAAASASLEQAHQDGAHDGGRLVGGCQLEDGVAYVEVDGVFRQSQDLGHVLRRFAVGGPFQDFGFPLGEGRGPLACPFVQDAGEGLVGPMRQNRCPMDRLP